ncbi:hypothetical protein GE09DRAFT_475278 [Coniochaeta sp. 2T2.1]|nr:hypothetical protein GE09DRAFT_475278 [Coniochaeta sp. 2T2.1]
MHLPLLHLFTSVLSHIWFSYFSIAFYLGHSSNNTEHYHTDCYSCGVGKTRANTQVLTSTNLSHIIKLLRLSKATQPGRSRTHRLPTRPSSDPTTSPRQGAPPLASWSTAASMTKCLLLNRDWRVN